MQTNARLYRIPGSCGPAPAPAPAPVPVPSPSSSSEPSPTPSLKPEESSSTSPLVVGGIVFLAPILLGAAFLYFNSGKEGAIGRSAVGVAENVEEVASKKHDQDKDGMQDVESMCWETR